MMRSNQPTPVLIVILSIVSYLAVFDEQKLAALTG
jgi:hypothetical protein